MLVLKLAFTEEILLNSKKFISYLIAYLQDIARYCPTVFASVPRVYNKFYDAIKTGTNSLEGIKKSLVDFGVSSKLENLHKNADYKSSIWDTLVFNKIKQAFGG